MFSNEALKSLTQTYPTLSIANLAITGRHVANYDNQTEFLRSRHYIEEWTSFLTPLLPPFGRSPGVGLTPTKFTTNSTRVHQTIPSNSIVSIITNRPGVDSYCNLILSRVIFSDNAIAWSFSATVLSFAVFVYLCIRVISARNLRHGPWVLSVALLVSLRGPLPST